MDDTRPTKLKFNNLVTKYDYAREYVPTHPSEEAQICLNCTAKKCKGECARLRAERKKLKGKCDGK